MIPLVRVDNRLLHGQVLETWIPSLGAGEIVVADDEAAASPLARAAMTLCVPPEVPARILRLGEVPWRELAASGRKVLVLVRDVATVVAARAAGLSPALAPKVNLGNVHFSVGRRPVTPSVFLSPEEVAALGDLVRAGFEVEARAIPTDSPVGFGEIERRVGGGAA